MWENVQLEMLLKIKLGKSKNLYRLFRVRPEVGLLLIHSPKRCGCINNKFVTYHGGIHKVYTFEFI